uniref:F-box protein n=1 Tax=Quercus lobata TaxID=97700 RepID=A0A7N2R5I2_QUELO
MSILQAPIFLYSMGPFSSCSCRRSIRATANAPKTQMSPLFIPTIFSRGLAEELEKDHNSVINLNTCKRQSTNPPEALVVAKFYAIMEAVADRVEMHKNIGAQRDNWNHLLLTSINSITLSAAIMAGLAAIGGTGTPLVALKVSSTLLYLAATVILVVMNKIQPSQLGEEQRNAARLFKQLYREMQTTMSLYKLTNIDVINEAMEKVLALDKAYPLPLLGAMIEKFPKTVEPTVWWPPKRQRRLERLGEEIDGNGWDGKLEEEMREIVGVLKRKDVVEYLRLSQKALKVNKILAISGPLLTGLAALGSCFLGTTHGAWAVMLAVIAGALASVVNTLEHGGKVGMVFEMYRSNAGFFRLMQEIIESNISLREERTENYLR